MILALVLLAAAASGENVTVPGCVAVVELVAAPGAPQSGKVLADQVVQVLGKRSGSSPILSRGDATALLQARRLGLPAQRDLPALAAVGKALQSAAVLDGMVLEYSDGSASSAAPGRVAVEVSLRLVDVATQRTLWEGSGNATGESFLRFQRKPMAKVAAIAVRRALGGLQITGNGACPAVGSMPLVTSPAETSIIAQDTSAGSTSPALRIVRTYSASTGEKKTIDISEVRVLHFNAEEVKLKPGMENLIEEIASVLRDNPDLRLVIEGHTDADGRKTGEQTFDLSLTRAMTVFHALRKQPGIDVRRLLVQAAGAKSPVAPNDGAFNRTLNRRVEFKFLAGGT